MHKTEKKMDLKNMLNITSLRARRESIKKVFFYRVCGTGMGAAACLLKEKGYVVEGGDSNFYPPMSTYLESTGIFLHKLDGIGRDFLKSFDLIVVGNVVAGGSDDARLIESSGISFCSFPTALGALVLSDVNVVGIAGTHGKTTTTYLAVQIFEALKSSPGYLIGGVIEGRPSSLLGKGSYFFIESDEYDSAYFEKISKFRSYSIDNLILTSLEFDHADIFGSIEDIKNQFRVVIPQIEKKLIFNLDYQAALELFNEFNTAQKVETRLKNEKWFSYGERSKAGPKILKHSSDGTSFSICYDKDEFIFNTNLVGVHNILNLSAVILFALTEGFNYIDIQNAIFNLKMVKRRQEERGYYKNALIIDDFAHHPRAVELTLDGIISKYPGKKIHVIMEPNSATARSSIFQVEFEAALAKASSVIFTRPTRPTNVKNAGNLDIEKIVAGVKKSGRQGVVVGHLAELLPEIEKIAESDCVILILSNGTCLGLWESEFIRNLKRSN